MNLLKQKTFNKLPLDCIKYQHILIPLLPGYLHWKLLLHHFTCQHVAYVLKY